MIEGLNETTGAESQAKEAAPALDTKTEAIVKAVVELNDRQYVRIGELEARVRRLEQVRDAEFERELGRRLQLSKAYGVDQCGTACAPTEDPSWRLRQLLRER